MEVVKEKYVSVEIEKRKNEIKYWKDCYYQKKKVFEELRCDFDNERNITEYLEKDFNKSYQVIQSQQEVKKKTI